MTGIEKTWLQRLVRQRERGEPSECIEGVDDALGRFPSMSAVFKRSLITLRADCYMDTDHWIEAIADYNLVLLERKDMTPSFIAPVFGNMGLCYWYLQRIDLAYRDLRRSLRYDPTDPHVLRNVGRLQFQRGKVRSAFIYLKRAVAVAPSDVLGHIVLADALATRARWAEAYREYVLALRLDASNERALQQIAKIANKIPKG